MAERTQVATGVQPFEPNLNKREDSCGPLQKHDSAVLRVRCFCFVLMVP